ncbi:MAG: hypothetical protein P1U89_08615 [Verrucomicrobiales bacterium]|nr:hypothetical protein [Verrucomicrobiales bacterium]
MSTKIGFQLILRKGFALVDTSFGRSSASTPAETDETDAQRASLPASTS